MNRPVTKFMEKFSFLFKNRVVAPKNTKISVSRKFC